MSNIAASTPPTARARCWRRRPGQLVVLLYDGARRFLRQAALAMGEGEVERAHNTCAAPNAIIATSTARSTSSRASCHSACTRSTSSTSRTCAPGCSQDPAKIDEVSELLGELRDAWAEVAAEAARA